MDNSQQTYLFSELYEQYMDDELLSGWTPAYMSEEEVKNSTHTKFDVELEFDKRSIVIEYSCTNVPEQSRVFECLVVDARSGAYTFEEFCDEFGFNNDSIKDRRIYKACKKNSAKLLELLGEELFDKFINCEIDV
jgi:hypothetical protein